jgi:hypothetical protein
MKKKLGRPRKTQGEISTDDFMRAGTVMSLYDQARQNGQKHSAAVRQSVELIKQRHPMMRISETELKRILVAWRPRGSHTILRFEYSTISGEELAKRSGIEAHPAAVSQDRWLKLPAPSGVIPPKSLTTYKVYFGDFPAMMARISSPLTTSSWYSLSATSRTICSTSGSSLSCESSSEARR